MNTRRIFVFGSNLAGRHGAGSAREAKERWGAVYGVGEGRQGDSYAIPTKDAWLHTLPLQTVLEGVERFVEYATAHSELEFLVVRIGCGLAGYKDYQIAPMFVNVPNNVYLPVEWRQFLDKPGQCVLQSTTYGRDATAADGPPKPSHEGSTPSTPASAPRSGAPTPGWPPRSWISRGWPDGPLDNQESKA